MIFNGNGNHTRSMEIIPISLFRFKLFCSSLTLMEKVSIENLLLQMNPCERFVAVQCTLHIIPHNPQKAHNKPKPKKLFLVDYFDKLNKFIHQFLFSWSECKL